jgi:hypothetical protein
VSTPPARTAPSYKGALRCRAGSTDPRYAAFTRRLREPLDPEIEKWIDAELDIFEGVDCYNA